MNTERRTPPSESCAVCGQNDGRMLSYTRLEDGARVTVCGNHKVAHRRAPRLATSVADLVQLVGERRVARTG